MTPNAFSNAVVAKCGNVSTLLVLQARKLSSNAIINLRQLQAYASRNL